MNTFSTEVKMARGRCLATETARLAWGRDHWLGVEPRRSPGKLSKLIGYLEKAPGENLQGTSVLSLSLGDPHYPGSFMFSPKWERETMWV